MNRKQVAANQLHNPIEHGGLGSFKSRVTAGS
jgi:hypothetical protein